MTNVHPTLTIVFKSVLRTIETEILKIVKSIQPQPKLIDVLVKKSVSGNFLILC